MNAFARMSAILLDHGSGDTALSVPAPEHDLPLRYVAALQAAKPVLGVAAHSG